MDFDPKLSELIRYKVSRIVGLKHHDREDLAQEAALHVLQQISRHDPARASRLTFADRVVSNRLKGILRHEAAQKRDPRRQCSLNAAKDVVDDGPTPNQLDLALDVKNILSRSSPDRSAVATLFMDDSGVAEVMRLTGRSLQQVRTMARKLAEDLHELRIRKKGEPTNQSATRRHI